VLELVERERAKASLPMPKAFDASVRRAYYRHAAKYREFIKSQNSEEQSLFLSPEGKERGTWAVDIERAAVWLATNIPGTMPITLTAS
jgi:hypothetical protein